ncbi:mucoidy inhibitor MuiA family protein [Amycolatopsis anabasis]|uniref:mucoidy inhibitor MuiA family protein n=1 Tax=Amycolatopsis anabasis TaxID=1840409 RepID=UPI00131AFAB3|nr:mucoidy inhibitor MuiA family protein [Amycolatopsis anabasis]
MDAPIVAVTVYPHNARITRRGRAKLGDGNRFAVSGLPLTLQQDSVRVSGSGPASIAGVEIATEHLPRTDDPEVRTLLDRQRETRARRDEVADAQAVEESRAELLGSLSRRSGGAFAKALSSGTAEPDRVAQVSGALAEQYAGVLARRRELTERHAELAEELAAIDRALQARQAAAAPDRVTVTVDLDPAADAPEDAEVELELSYVVSDAWWEANYDVRLRENAVAVTWHGMVTQSTGEDWPECELALSTARPASTVGVPELEPWFLDRVKPVRHFAQSAPAEPGSVGYGGAPRELLAAAPMPQQAAALEQGATAATYRPARPIAVPADAVAHRTTLAELEFEAELDYLTAPLLGEEAYLRAVVTNTSEHTLRQGRASVFHGNDFTGAIWLKGWAPGEETELALGVDDRVRVERKLVRRGASKGTLSGTRKREAEYRITVENHTARQATVTVLDQVPVSRDDAIKVREVHATPEPVQRTEMGELTWRLDLAAGATGEVTLAFRVDVDRGVEVSGWRE